MLRSAFDDGEQAPFAQLPPDNTPLTLVIDQPANGLVTSLPSVVVRGHYTGPASTGVAVNGIAALTDGQFFVTPRIPLELGANTLNVRFATLDLAPQTLQLVITRNAQTPQPVLLTTAGPGDYAPLRMRFSLSTSADAQQPQITRVQVDYDGDGTFEVDGSQPQSLGYDFSRPGLFVAHARVTFDDGNPNTPPVIAEDRVPLLAQHLPFTRQTQCAAFYALKSRLQAGQISGALNVLMPELRPRFTKVWNTLAGNNALPVVASRLGVMVDGQLARSTAQWTVAVPTAQLGVFRGYPVQFRRDVTGVWRISSF